MNKINKFVDDLVKFKISKNIMDKYKKFLIALPLLYYVLYFTLLFCMRMMYVNTAILNGCYLILIIFTLLILYVFIYDIKNKKINFNLIDKVFVVYILFCVIATIFSREPIYAIIGKDGRNEGIFTLIFYFFYYFLCRSYITRDNMFELIKLFFFFGFSQVIFGILQSFFDIYPAFKQMAFGFSGNPNMFGLLMCMLSTVAICFYLHDTGLKTFYLISTIIFYIGLLLGESSGPFFTFVLMLIIILVYLIIKKAKITRLIVLMAIFVFTFPLIQFGNVYINNKVYNRNIDYPSIYGDVNGIFYKIANKFIDLPNMKKATSDISSGRIDIWKITLDDGIKNWANGVGPDCIELYIVNKDKVLIVNKAHNNYI